ncbi:MAG TPA: response regulator [Alphaproteobacteria bacterium]|nr:response regulator [Alphaproteobacteria bacterium]
MLKEPILIIEDNPSNLKLVKTLLTVEGYEIQTATNAEEAIEVLKNFRPRLILMDLQLPGMDGLQLTQKLKHDARFKTIIIIALTAYAMTRDKEKALAAGCDGYMTKPIDVKTFSNEVLSYLKKSKSGVFQ